MKIDRGLASPRTMAAIVLVLASLALPAAAGRVTADANPIGKVIEMLGALSKDIMAQGDSDAEGYKSFADFHENESKHAKEIIKEQGDKIESLENDLKEAEAFREGKNKELVDVANHMAEGDGQLTAGRTMRKEEREVFEKDEATYVQSIDELERAIEVMQKEAPATAFASVSASPAKEPSLIAVGKQLRKTLEHGFDLTLSSSERETLNNFLRTAYNVGDASSRGQMAPSFLQDKARSNGDYGEFKSSTTELEHILAGLLDHTHNLRNDALKDEEHQLTVFKEWETDISTELENAKKYLSDIRSAVAQSQQQSSQNQVSLMEAKDIFKSELEHLQELEAHFRTVTEEYKERLTKRSDEAIAVHEAQRILDGMGARDYIKYQTIGTVDDNGKAASLLQVLLERQAVWNKASHNSGFSFLGVKSTVHLRSGMRRDPFRKVKSMIKGMLDRLMDAQAKESEHMAWCDKEMGKTAKESKRTENDVRKTTDRLEALTAEIDETNSDLTETTKDLKDVEESMAEAIKLHSEEHERAKAMIKTYKEGAVLLSRACKILKGYYGEKTKASSGGKENEFKQRRGTGSGIIAILEVAISDFEKLYNDARHAQEMASADFNKLESETHIRTAVFQKTLDYKTRTLVKLELDESNMRNDLKSYEKELAAINSYAGKLKTSCVVHGPSYQEKKARREEQLASLKEALAAIEARDA